MRKGFFLFSGTCEQLYAYIGMSVVLHGRDLVLQQTRGSVGVQIFMEVLLDVELHL